MLGAGASTALGHVRLLVPREQGCRAVQMLDLHKPPDQRFQRRQGFHGPSVRTFKGIFNVAGPPQDFQGRTFRSCGGSREVNNRSRVVTRLQKAQIGQRPLTLKPFTEHGFNCRQEFRVKVRFGDVVVSARGKRGSK